MPEQHLSFQIEGPDAKELADELQGVLAREFGSWPVRREQARPPGPGEEVRGDTLDLITLLVGIPSGVLATWDLATRLKMKEKAQNLLAWASGRLARGGRILLHRPGGSAVPLDCARVDEIVNALNEMAARNSSERQP